MWVVVVGSVGRSVVLWWWRPKQRCADHRAGAAVPRWGLGLAGLGSALLALAE